VALTPQAVPLCAPEIWKRWRLYLACHPVIKRETSPQPPLAEPSKSQKAPSFDFLSKALPHTNSRVTPTHATPGSACRNNSPLTHAGDTKYKGSGLRKAQRERVETSLAISNAVGNMSKRPKTLLWLSHSNHRLHCSVASARWRVSQNISTSRPDICDLCPNVYL
jgi:hypothetical protein